MHLIIFYCHREDFRSSPICFNSGIVYHHRTLHRRWTYSPIFSRRHRNSNSNSRWSLDLRKLWRSHYRWSPQLVVNLRRSLNHRKHPTMTIMTMMRSRTMAVVDIDSPTNVCKTFIIDWWPSDVDNWRRRWRSEWWCGRSWSNDRRRRESSTKTRRQTQLSGARRRGSKTSARPYYSKKRISKDEYKSIMSKTVPKICKNKGKINQRKIQAFVHVCATNDDKVEEVRERHFIIFLSLLSRTKQLCAVAVNN